MKNKDLAVTCCYFNPFEYRKKYSNFLDFYYNLKSQGLYIQVVELCYNKESSSLPDDIDKITLNSSQVLWHKENLLNIGIKHLIDLGYTNISWMDSDILFKDSHWIEDTIQSLKNYNLCQLFSSVEDENTDGSSRFGPGCVKEWSYTGSLMPTSRPYFTGYAWASTANVLSKCLLYDKAILGGGDSLIWLASFFNSIDICETIKGHPISHLDLPEYVVHYLNWSSIWGGLINSKVSYLNHGIKTLSHGSTSNRSYKSRYHILSKFNYNPMKDIYYKNGLIQTCNSKLHLEIVNYFKNRNEDELFIFQKILKYIKRKTTLLNMASANRFCP